MDSTPGRNIPALDKMFRVMYNGGEPSGRRNTVYYIQELLRDPVATLTVILLALPGRCLLYTSAP